MANTYTHSEENVARFYGQFGDLGKTILNVFNSYDFLGLNPNAGDVPPDEYLSYAQRLVKLLQKVPERMRTETKIARLLFQTFRPEEFLGIMEASKEVGPNNEMQKVFSDFDTPMITVDDVIAISKNIFAEMKRGSIRLVVDNTK